MKTVIIHTGIGLLAAGAIGIILAIVMEIITGEPVYFLVMKVTALAFGLGGGLIGLGALKRK